MPDKMDCLWQPRQTENTGKLLNVVQEHLIPKLVIRTKCVDHVFIIPQ